MYNMERADLYVFYNLFMMSIYIGIEWLRPVVLITLACVYIIIIFTRPNVSLLAWQAVWGSVVLMFMLRDFAMIHEVWIIIAFILCITLLYTVMMSCYVIMLDSKHWAQQLFMISALYWVLFHDSNEWMLDTPAMMFIPAICMGIVRLKDEKLCWILVLFLEFTNLPFYVYAIVYIGNIAYVTNRHIVGSMVFMPLIIPSGACYCLYNFIRYKYTIQKSFDKIFILVSGTDPEFTPSDDTL